jgi:hypothetical protein
LTVSLILSGQMTLEKPPYWGFFNSKGNLSFAMNISANDALRLIMEMFIHFRNQSKLMKFSKKNLSIFKLAGAAVLATTLIVGSAYKDSDAPAPRLTKVKVINGMFDNPSYVIKVNGKTLNSTPLAYRKSTEYTAIPASGQLLTVTEQGSNKVVLSSNLKIAAGTSASFYLVPQTANSKATGFIIPDDLSNIAPKKAKVRFVNLSPDSENLDLLVNGKTVKTATGIGFKEATSFVEIDPQQAATFEIRKSGTDQVLAKSAAVNIKEGQFTTLWSVGPPVKSKRGTTIALGVINNQ